MNIIPTLQRVRSLCPSYKTVEPAGDMMEIELKKTPLAFIHPASVTAGPNSSMDITTQRMTSAFAVLSAAPLVDGNTEPLAEARAELLAALIGWQQSEDYFPVVFESGEIIETRPGFTVWRDLFTYGPPIVRG